MNESADLEQDAFGRARGSRSRYLFSRVIQTYGQSAFGRHALVRRGAFLRALSAGALALALPASAHAQAYQRIAPIPPPAHTPPPLAVPPPPPPLPASKRVILPALKGLVFVNNPNSVVKSGLPVSAVPSGIAIHDLPLLDRPGFRAKIAPAIGKPLTLAGLDEAAAAVTAWYRAHDRPFVDVAVPPQNISSGVVQIVVEEYRVSTVQVTGNHWFSSTLIRRESGIVPGQELTLEGLQADLDWLNRNPFRIVDLVLSPGQDDGGTNVVLQTHDRLPLHVYGTYDNEGVKSLGLSEWGAGFTWGNVAGLDQIFSYQLTRAFSGRYTAHAMSWSAPLPWRDELVVFGSYELQIPDIAPGFDDTGRSGQASLRYVHPLPRLSWLRQQIALGYDFKITNTNLDFGGFTVFSSAAEIDQFPLVYNATESDRYGGTMLENDLILSPGGLTGQNTNNTFATLVPGASARYAYDRLALTRLTRLPAGLTWIARGVAQVSSSNLLDSEQLEGGGPDSVRGYYTDTALGSEGTLISMEIRSPPIKPLGLLGLHAPAEDEAQLGVFWDYANLNQVKPIPDLQNHVVLGSVGPDLSYALGRYANVSASLGWQLYPAPGTTKTGTFAQVSLIAGF